MRTKIMTLPKAPPLAEADITRTRVSHHWRGMTHLIILWCVLVFIWAVVGGVRSANTCSHQTGNLYLTAGAAKNACEAGAGIGIGIILLIGFCGFVVLSLIWLMTRPREFTS